MDEYYNQKQAMERLGFLSVNAFRRLERHYPDIFVNINPKVTKNAGRWYDRAKVDKFAETRKLFLNWDETR
jgi:hypothetical protein